MNGSIALLVVDMQEQFRSLLTRDSHLDQALEHIQHVAGRLRAAGHTVVWVHDIEGVRADDPAAQVIPELEVDPNDLVSQKTHSNAFWGTDLSQRLSGLGVELVVVAGFAAEHCALFTYEGARERGFTAVMLQNGLVSTDPAAVAAAMSQRHVISYPVLEFLIDQTRERGPVSPAQQEPGADGAR